MFPWTKSKTICIQCFFRKLQTQDTKIKKEIQGTLFDRLLYLSTVKELDLKRVLAYPLTSVPLTFAHIDGLRINSFQ